MYETRLPIYNSFIALDRGLIASSSKDKLNFTFGVSDVSFYVRYSRELAHNLRSANDALEVIECVYSTSGECASRIELLRISLVRACSSLDE